MHFKGFATISLFLTVTMTNKVHSFMVVAHLVINNAQVRAINSVVVLNLEVPNSRDLQYCGKLILLSFLPAIFWVERERSPSTTPLAIKGLSALLTDTDRGQETNR